MTEEVNQETETVDNSSVFAGMEVEAPVVDTEVESKETDTDATDKEETSESGTEELILGKFKNQEDLADAYKNLESKMGGLTGSPEEYTLDAIETEGFTFYEGVDNDIEGFKDLAKELNLNQEGFDQIVQYYAKSEMGRAGLDVQARQDAAVELFGGKEKLAKEFNTTEAKMKATLGDEGVNLLRQATSATPDATGAVVKLVGQLLGKETAPMNSDTAIANAPKHTRAELNEMMRDSRYSSDKSFRDEVTKGFQALYK